MSMEKAKQAYSWNSYFLDEFCGPYFRNMTLENRAHLAMGPYLYQIRCVERLIFEHDADTWSTRMIDRVPAMPDHKAVVLARPHLSHLRASLQSLLNDATQADSAKVCQIADLQNQAPPPPPRKRRKRHNRFEDAPQSVNDAPALEERVREAGRGFAVEESLFLINEKDTWDPQREALAFDPEHEYDAEENRVQSQIDEIADILPRKARGMRTEEWIADTFMDGLKQQRSTAAHRVRQASASYLVDADDRA
ncbi:hypothetical protein R3P38DRAFT_2780752 [Favolaschia claudopus]|uniref:Uncharacterized protein n=1 Tax=Favolaschia claudopus TaxID=2862362 RepID=A0AAW0B799_9AGAR